MPHTHASLAHKKLFASQLNLLSPSLPLTIPILSPYNPTCLFFIFSSHGYWSEIALPSMASFWAFREETSPKVTNYFP